MMSISLFIPDLRDGKRQIDGIGRLVEHLTAQGQARRSLVRAGDVDVASGLSVACTPVTLAWIWLTWVRIVELTAKIIGLGHASRASLARVNQPSREITGHDRKA